MPEEHVFQDVKEQLKYNRYLANMQGGYSVANGMKEAIHYLQYGELHIDEVSGFYLFRRIIPPRLATRTNCCIYKTEWYK